MIDPKDPEAAQGSIAAYIADMLSQLADMARLNGQVSLAVAIRMAALQALLVGPEGDRPLPDSEPERDV